MTPNLPLRYKNVSLGKGFVKISEFVPLYGHTPILFPFLAPILKQSDTLWQYACVLNALLDSWRC